MEGLNTNCTCFTPQETLEEAAQKRFPINHNLSILERMGLNSAANMGFIEGAKWQAERMYSDEDVLKFTQTIISQYKSGNTNIENIDLLTETLEKFKNSLKLSLMNCLKYLIDKIYDGNQMTILYNDDHVIGIGENEIFDYNGQFKQELLTEKSNLTYYSIEKTHDVRIIIRIFDLNDRQAKILTDYYNQKLNKNG